MSKINQMLTIAICVVAAAIVVPMFLGRGFSSPVQITQRDMSAEMFEEHSSIMVQLLEVYKLAGRIEDRQLLNFCRQAYDSRTLVDLCYLQQKQMRAASAQTAEMLHEVRQRYGRSWQLVALQKRWLACYRDILVEEHQRKVAASNQNGAAPKAEDAPAQWPVDWISAAYCSRAHLKHWINERNDTALARNDQ